MCASIRKFLQSSDGAVSIEYVILATMIALVTIASISSIGSRLSGEFSQFATVYK
jgi:Flp pilus assembly pilin Flp